MVEIKKFILGKSNIPKWFNEKCLQGKAKIDYDDDGEMVGATIHTPTKTIKAKLGDGILLNKSGLQVVPKVIKNEAHREDKAEMEQ